jgi:outer membrane protein assembly factor BamE (lipoprotein component of BamABCDE complex)
MRSLNLIMVVKNAKMAGARGILAAGLLAVVGGSGCVTQGKYFPSETEWVKANQTQQKDVRQLLGDPHFVGSSGGTPTWTYGYYKYRLVGQSSTKELKLYWNPDNTVRNYSFTSSFPEDTRTERKTPIEKPASDVSR